MVSKERGGKGGKVTGREGKQKVRGLRKGRRREKKKIYIKRKKGK